MVVRNKRDLKSLKKEDLPEQAVVTGLMDVRGPQSGYPTTDLWTRFYHRKRVLLIGDQCGAHTFPYIDTNNPGATVEHEATTSKISDDQLFYLQQRGIDVATAGLEVLDGLWDEVKEVAGESGGAR